MDPRAAHLVTPEGEAFDTAAVGTWLPWNLLINTDFLYLEVRLVLSAMGIIFMGAHGALRRPPSAAPPKPNGDGKNPKDDKSDQFTDGLRPSDAIMFPLMAGIMLMGLYYLIQWLQDPAILNKILRVYMSAISLASMGKLSGDALHLLTNFVFPRVWANRSGVVFRIDSKHRRHCRLDGSSKEEGGVVDKKMTPFPGLFSKWSFSSRVNGMLWELRHLLTEEWTVRFAVHGMFHEKFGIKLNDILGMLVAIAVTSIYYLTNSPILSNLMGFGFCYGAFMIMSCTSFLTGTLVLVGLFVYDIIMVFYTPYMITVATTLDVPIKLVFEGGAKSDGSPRSSLLGLGDIIVPGMMMCLSLRFDLWRYYQKQVKYVPVELTTQTKCESSDRHTVTTTTETRYRTVKTPFVSPQGQWGDRLWTTRLWKLFASPTATADLIVAGFPKTYFYASMAGYAAGMVVTLAMLKIFKHGQPALLYLVPAVVGSIWLAGYLNGEIHDMWMYTEDGSLDMQDVIVELDADGKILRDIKSGEEDSEESKKDKDREKSNRHRETTGKTKAEAERAAREKGYDVFVLSISAPGQGVLED